MRETFLEKLPDLDSSGGKNDEIYALRSRRNDDSFVKLSGRNRKAPKQITRFGLGLGFL